MHDFFELSSESAGRLAESDPWSQRAERLLREAYLSGAERERMERIALDPAPGRADEIFVEEIERREGR
ncbi:MAG: hypothetical protein JSR82_03415 [Verrucomicrobia bacterium]|nr:hypothetical protein [Verrucomicrobiota bacterium]